MKKLFYTLGAVFLCCFLFLPVSLGGEAEWTLAKEDKGVEVFTRPRPGTEIMEFKAVGVIPARMETIHKVLEDIPRYPDWMSKCKETRVVKDLGDLNFLVYFAQSLPWPVANRDVVLLANTIFHEKKGEVEVLMERKEDGTMPPEDGMVRMPGFSGNITLSYVDRDHTRMAFTLWGDPGGSLPAAGVNGGTLNIPYKTLLGMKKMAKKKKYIQAGKTSITKTMIENFEKNK